MSSAIREAARALLEVLRKIEDAPNQYVAAAMCELDRAILAPEAKVAAFGIAGNDGEIDTLRFPPKVLADEECARRNSPEHSNDPQKIVARRPFIVVPLYAYPVAPSPDREAKPAAPVEAKAHAKDGEVEKARDKVVEAAKALDYLYLTPRHAGSSGESDIAPKHTETALSFNEALGALLAAERAAKEGK